MSNTNESTLREMIYEHFSGKSFSPLEVSELTGRDLRSVRTSLQRFTRANFVVRSRRGEYVLNPSHPQVMKLAGIASPVADTTPNEEVSVESVSSSESEAVV